MTGSGATPPDDLPVALVTGGEGALGSAMRRLFSERGYRVASVDKTTSPEKAGEASGADPSAGATLRVLADVSSADSVRAAIDQVMSRFGRLDVLVNNAGAANRTDTAALSEHDWHAVINTHLTGTFLCSQAAYPALRNSDRAAIVNISSVVAHLGLPRRAAYSAAKAGIEGLTRCLAGEWAQDGIRVNALAPGYIRTPHHEAMFSQGIMSESLIRQRTPLGDLGVPTDVASATVFLASHEARFITGQLLIVDGGLSIHAGIDPPARPETDTHGGARDS